MFLKMTVSLVVVLFLGLATGCGGVPMTASQMVKQPITVYVPDGYTAEQAQECVDKINSEKHQLEQPLVLSTGSQKAAVVKSVLGGAAASLVTGNAYQINKKMRSDTAQLKLDMCLGVLKQ